MLAPPALRPSLIAVALLAALVLCANLATYRLRPPGYTLELGTRPDRAQVAGFHGGERDSAGTSYRWTSGDATLTLYGPAAREPAIARLALGWLPPGTEAPRQVMLRLDGAPWITLAAPDQPRHYALLMPPGVLADGAARIEISSDTTVVPPDKRHLGIRLDTASLAWSGSAWPLPAPVVLGAQLSLCLLWLGIARLLGVPLLAASAVALALIGALVAHTALAPALAVPWQSRLIGAGLMSTAIVWGASAVLPRVTPGVSTPFVRALLLITLAALFVRLLGVLYPLFFSHDLLVNSGRLRNVQLGDLILFDRPSEFSRRVAVVSPTAFILLAPLSLLGDRAFALQVGYSLLDGLTPLLVALLALRLGLRERAALMAAGLIALLPMHLTALYWGFVKQIVGQWLTLLFFVVVAGPPPRRRLGQIAAGTLCTVLLLVHPGGLLLAGIAMGLVVLLGLWPRLRAVAFGQVAPRLALAGDEVAPYRIWLIIMLAASGMALAVQYAEAARLMVGGLLDGSTATPDSTNQLEDQGARLWQIWVGLNASFEPLPLALVAFGLAALLWRARGHGRLLVVGWLASAALFLGVDLVTGQQVRYGYFSAPLACIGVAALVEPLLRWRAGRLAVWGLVALVVIAGLALWGAAIGWGVKPTVNPLTH
ncbi:MAG: hypothetical protein OHK0015_34900 [Chloroflexi bacterium OHK40]